VIIGEDIGFLQHLSSPIIILLSFDNFFNRLD